MSERLSTSNGYQPIADYAVIGDRRTAALVGRNGSIDWCCMPGLDAPSVFGALLDARRGGRFRIAPPDDARSELRYLPHTNVVETTFPSEHGRVVVTDWMPLAASRPAICRLVECTAGEADLAVEWSPRLGYAAKRTRVEAVSTGFLCALGEERMTLCGLPLGARIVDDGSGPTVCARLRMTAGDRVALVSQYGSAIESPPLASELRASLDATCAAWREWVSAAADRSAWAGEWTEQVIRSELALALLTDARSGAIAAAATTSLPEVVGGSRNWDFRFAWIRDGGMSARALLLAGHWDEARAFLAWAERAWRGESRGRTIRSLYRIDGGPSGPERELAHLEGYRGSRPVRVGNAAAGQVQHDVYGELLWTAHELARAGGELSPALRDVLAWLADEACAAWRAPDCGIWEMRTDPRHFVHSKVMVWVALDRAVRLAGDYALAGDVARWRRERGAVRRAVLSRGVDRRTGALSLAFDSTELDSANLLIPAVGFLRPNDARVRATIEQIMARLMTDGLVSRHSGDDGLLAHANAFAPCTFWLVQALAACGRVADARELLHGVAARANHVGLFAEQFARAGRELFGNFPQALTHAAFIDAVRTLASAR